MIYDTYINNELQEVMTDLQKLLDAPLPLDEESIRKCLREWLSARNKQSAKYQYPEGTVDDRLRALERDMHVLMGRSGPDSAPKSPS